MSMAKLKCRELVTSNDPKFLSQVLAEMGEYTLAIDLALAHKISPAYALCELYRHSDDKLEINKYYGLLDAHECIDFVRWIVSLKSGGDTMIQVP